MMFFCRLTICLVLSISFSCLLPSARAAELRAVWADYSGERNPIYLGRLQDGVWVSELFEGGLRFNANAAPCLAIDNAGNLTLLWAGREEGSLPRIYFSLRRGGEWTAPETVESGAEGWECTPFVALDGRGRPWAAWARVVGESTEIFCAAGRGSGFGAPVMVSSPDGTPDDHPSIALRENGEPIVVWKGWENGYTQIFASRFHSGAWSGEEAVASAPGYDQSLPSARRNEKGELFVSWRQEGESVDLKESADGAFKQTGPPEPLKVAGKDFPALSGDAWILRQDETGPWQHYRCREIRFPLPRRGKETGRRISASRHFIGLGDSITYGHDDGSDDDYWYGSLLAGLLESSHPENTYHLYNEGYPGAYTGQLLNGWTQWDPTYPGINGIIDRYPDATKILLMAGTNDLKGLVPCTTIKQNLGAMVDRSRNKGVEPILATIIPILKYGDAGFNATSDLCNNYIAPLAGEKGCLLADSFQVYLDYYYTVGSWEALYDYPGGGDGIHPVWPEGDQKIADAWFTAFSAPVMPVLDSGDYNGDGTSDIAVFRRSSGLWAIRGLTRLYFGGVNDTPAPGDYDGDGTTELAVYRESSGLWAVRDLTRLYLGGVNDTSVPGDYDGDGTCEAGIFRPANGLWAIPGVTRTYFGAAGDLPVPGYYDRNNPRTKLIATFRPGNALWTAPGLTRVYYGAMGDVPVPEQYNQDKDDWEIGVFRPSSGLWSIPDTRRAYFGSSVDQPAPADYEGDRFTDFAVFRDITGLWAVQEVTRVYFGTSGDQPVTGRAPRPAATP